MLDVITKRGGSLELHKLLGSQRRAAAQQNREKYQQNKPDQQTHQQVNQDTPDGEMDDHAWGVMESEGAFA